MEGDGVVPLKIKAIDVAADKYVDIRDKRMEWTEKELAARSELVARMRENKLNVYRYGDHEVVLKPGEDKVKVRNVDGTETEEEE